MDDPYWFGAIAAANSLSDVYAMGGKPAFALNIVAFPRKSDKTPFSMLGEILRGGAEKAKEAGIDIVGGHTIDDNEPKYGLCVTGFVHPDRIWRNVGARPGDRLVLTKPLGVGIVTTAIRAGKSSEELARQAGENMAALNRRAAEAASGFGVHACTDVTGFGFLGHLREMLSDGDVGARVNTSSVPVLEGARALAAQGNLPGGSLRNKKTVDSCTEYDAAVSEEDRLILCDAQTSGGLLFAVERKKSQDLVSALKEAGVDSASEVGEFIESGSGKIEVAP